MKIGIIGAGQIGGTLTRRVQRQVADGVVHDRSLFMINNLPSTTELPNRPGVLQEGLAALGGAFRSTLGCVVVPLLIELVVAKPVLNGLHPDYRLAPCSA